MNSIVQYMLESAVCLSLFYIAYRVFLRNETFFHLNRVYLVSSLFLAFILPAFNIPSPFFRSRAVGETLGLSLTSSPLAPAWGMAEIIFLIYATGAVFFLLRFAFHLIKLFCVVGCYGTRRSNGLRIVSVNKDFTPFSFFHYIFINDEQLTDYSFRHIVAHERIHIKQVHSLDILLMELATIFQWFNPFVWPYKKSLQETHEYLADYGVIAQGFSAAGYRLLMLEHHVGIKLFEFASNFKQSQIKRRMTMMTKNKSRAAARLKLLIVLPLASLLVLALAEPRPAAKAELHAGDTFVADPGDIGIFISPVQSADKKNEEEIKKEKWAQAKNDLAMLKEKEADLRKKLDKTENPEEKAELKGYLKKVLEKEKEIQAMLAENGAMENDGLKKLKEEMTLLASKEKEIKAELEKTEDPEKRAELKKSLAKIYQKQKSVQAELQSYGKFENPTVEDLKNEYKALQDKEMKIKDKMKAVKDPGEKAEIEKMLQKVLTDQEKIKQKVEEMKAAKEAGKKI